VPLHLDQNQMFSQRLQVQQPMHYHNETQLITAAFILIIKVFLMHGLRSLPWYN